MENIFKFLYVTFGAMMFCLAVTFALHNEKIVQSIMNEQQQSFVDKDVLTQNEDEHEKYSVDNVPYEEVIGSLLTESEYPIRISGVLVDKNEFEEKNFNFNSIRKKTYKKIYVYENGTIKEIQYN